MDRQSQASGSGGERTAYLALSLATLSWASNFIAGRAIGSEIGPLELNTLRWAICLALLLPFTARRIRQHRCALFREWRLVAILGATGIATFHVMVYQALRLTPAVNALLILAMAPVTIAICGTFANGFRPGRWQILGLAASLIGAAVLIVHGDWAGLNMARTDVGKLWMLGAILVWTVYSLFLRRRPADLPQDVTLTASVIVALILLLPLLFAKGFGTVTVTPALVAAVLYIAVFASLAGFLLWSQGLARIGPERAGQFIHLMPLFGTAMAVIFLGERIALSHLVGGIFIIAGIALVNWSGAPRQVQPQEGPRSS